MKHIRIGKYECYSLSDGYFRLDGGSMFGITPKSIWNKFYEADEKNRIRLGLTPLLIAGNGIVLLIEGGIGQVFQGNEKLNKIYAIEKTNLLEENLRETGFTSENINIVTYSHLHWDHSGTACKLNSAGNFIPRFPKAEYIVQKGEWEIAISGNSANRASYIPESLLPIRDSGQLKIIENDYNINDDIKLIVIGGHTQFHMAVMIRSDEQSLIFWGDLIPTSLHIHIPYIMAYDQYPADTYQIKEKLLKLTCEKNFISAFPHDLELGFGKIKYNGKNYYLAEKISD